MLNMKKQESVRVHIVMKEQIFDWVEEAAFNYGMSKSGFINMCVAQFKQQQEMMAFANKMPNLIDQMREVAMEVKKNEK